MKWYVNDLKSDFKGLPSHVVNPPPDPFFGAAAPRVVFPLFRTQEWPPVTLVVTNTTQKSMLINWEKTERHTDQRESSLLRSRSGRVTGSVA